MRLCVPTWMTDHAAGTLHVSVPAAYWLIVRPATWLQWQPSSLSTGCLCCSCARRCIRFWWWAGCGWRPSWLSLSQSFRPWGVLPLTILRKHGECFLKLCFGLPRRSCGRQPLQACQFTIRRCNRWLQGEREELWELPPPRGRKRRHHAADDVAPPFGLEPSWKPNIPEPALLGQRSFHWGHTESVVAAAGPSGLPGDHLREAIIASCHVDEVAVQLAAVIHRGGGTGPSLGAGWQRSACVIPSRVKRRICHPHCAAVCATSCRSPKVDFSNAFNTVDRGAVLGRFACICLAWLLGPSGAMAAIPGSFFTALL